MCTRLQYSERKAMFILNTQLFVRKIKKTGSLLACDWMIEINKASLYSLGEVNIHFEKKSIHFPE